MTKGTLNSFSRSWQPRLVFGVDELIAPFFERPHGNVHDRGFFLAAICKVLISAGYNLGAFSVRSFYAQPALAITKFNYSGAGAATRTNSSSTWMTIQVIPLPLGVSAIRRLRTSGSSRSLRVNASSLDHV
jgi:hypothetical protein